MAVRIVCVKLPRALRGLVRLFAKKERCYIQETENASCGVLRFAYSPLISRCIFLVSLPKISW